MQRIHRHRRGLHKVALRGVEDAPLLALIIGFACFLASHLEWPAGRNSLLVKALHAFQLMIKNSRTIIHLVHGK